MNLLRIETAMGNMALHESLFIINRVTKWKRSTTNSFFAAAHSNYSSNPTLTIDEQMKTSIINSLVTLARFLVSLDAKLSCCKNVEDKTPSSLAIEIRNIHEYILRTLLQI